jgi:uncharacterized protein
MDTATHGLQALEQQPTVSLTTFRSDGSPVATAVNLAVDGDRAFFRTWDTSGKAKRLRRNAGVRIAPCTFRGKPTGAGLPAVARPVEGDDVERARALIEGKHPVLQGFLVRFGHRFTGRRTIYYEVVPLSATGS